MSHKTTGTLHKVFPTASLTPTFQAREFILAVPGNYPQLVKFQLVQDRCGLIDNYTEGQEITVHFDLRGRKWTGPEGEAKYFTSLNAWRIDEAGPAPEPEPEPEETPHPEHGMTGPDVEMAGVAEKAPEKDDDLPF